jgi:hypothetical protein
MKPGCTSKRNEPRSVFGLRCDPKQSMAPTTFAAICRRRLPPSEGFSSGKVARDTQGATAVTDATQSDVLGEHNEWRLNDLGLTPFEQGRPRIGSSTFVS